MKSREAEERGRDSVREDERRDPHNGGGGDTVSNVCLDILFIHRLLEVGVTATRGQPVATFTQFRAAPQTPVAPCLLRAEDSI